MQQPRANFDIRIAVSSAGLYLWQVAETLGITDATFSRKLRRELSDTEKAAILAAVEKLKGEQNCD